MIDSPILRPRSRARASVRGSALVSVLLLVLVLTALGLGISYFSTVEDRVSGNAKLEKAGFYAAEAGLRAGEAAINAGMTGSMSPGTFLVKADPSAYPNDAYLPPGGGNYAAPLVVTTSAGTTTYSEVAVAMSGLATTNPNQAYYTLYVRNNAEDSGGPTNDTDSRLNLIAVGRVSTPGGPGIVKVLEEQINLNPQGGGAGTQKGGNTGGTGGGTKT